MIFSFNFNLFRWRLLQVLFSAFALLGPLPAYAEDVSFSGLTNPFPREGRSNYVVRSWGQADGLSRNAVHSIAQTPDGFLWLGTSAGLARFDGSQFKIFSPYTTPSVPPGTIKGLFVDSRGRMWIGSLGGRISMMEHGELVEIDVSSVSAYGVLHFAEDNGGRIWVAADGGLFYVDGRMLVNDPAKAGPNVRSATVGIDSDSGDVYTCYWESLVHWAEGGKTLVYTDQPQRRLMSQSIYPRKDGGLWFLSASLDENGAVARLLEPDRATTPQKWPFQIPQYSIGAFLEDRRRNLWISVYDQGVYRVGPDGEYEQFKIGNGKVVALFEDQDGSIWAGSSLSGLTRLKQGLFQNISAPGSGQVGTVSEAPFGGIIFNQGSSSFRIQDGEVERLNMSGLIAAYASKAGHLWAAIPGGLNQYLWNGLDKPLTLGSVSTIQPAKQIRCFYEAENGQMWFGSSYGGLLVSDGESIRAFPESRMQEIHSITEDDRGTLWAGGHEGDLWYIREGRATRMDVKEGVGGRAIAALHFDDQGVLWMGTRGKGLVFLKGDEFVATRAVDGLPSDEVAGIVGVGAHLWLATTGGIARVNRDELYSRTVSSGPLSECLVFGPDDGLLDFSCSSLYSPNMHRAQDGRLWISMVENLVSVDPQEVTRRTKIPQVYIEEVRVNDEVAEFSEEALLIPPGATRLSIAYTAVMLEAPERTRFQYRLDGLDTDWVEAWGQRTANYNSPPPGDYLFRVRASDSHGAWGGEGATIKLSIDPHFYQTLLFKASVGTLIGTIFGVLVWLAARVKLSRKLAVLERDNAVEKERTRIASEIHDKLGAQLTQILFQSQSLTGRLGGEADEQSAQQASRVNSSAQELARGLDEVVWATNPAMDNLEGLVAYISGHAEEFFRHTPIRLRFDVPLVVDTREMTSDVRHNFFLAASEAMTNLLKHSQASEASIRMNARGNEFVVEVSDDGVGLISPNLRRSGNGLRNISERMRRIGGVAEFLPRQPRGLTVRLSVAVPASLEALSPKKGSSGESSVSLD